VDPVIKPAVARVGRAELGGNEPVGQQKRQYHKDPPEILAVADRRNRCRRLGDKHHADDRQDDVCKPELIFLHGLSQLFSAFETPQ
jgi:hypothetical protein